MDRSTFTRRQTATGLVVITIAMALQITALGWHLTGGLTTTGWLIAHLGISVLGAVIITATVTSDLAAHHAHRTAQRR